MLKNRGVFITGTDTGVGKTIVAAALAKHMKSIGLSIGVMKPVTSGCSVVDGALVSDDAELLIWAAESTDNRRDIAPFLLREPIAPSEAAAQDGVRIDHEVLTTAYEKLAAVHDLVIVEGSGGLMVPLIGGYLIADLIIKLNIPLIVVARPNLGTVNHTILTCYAARNLGIKIIGVIINNFPINPGKAEESAPHLISSLAGAPVLGVFPHIETVDPSIAVTELATHLAGEDMTRLLLRLLGML